MKKYSLMLGGVAIVLFSTVAVAIGTACAEGGFAKCGGSVAYYIRDAVRDTAGKIVAGDRFVIERTDIWRSWGVSDSELEHVSKHDLNSYPLRGALPYAPGTLVKTPDDYKVYAVTRGRVLRHVITPHTARRHFGSAWNTKVRVIPESWMSQYQVGSPIYDHTWFAPGELSRNSAALYEITASDWKKKAAERRDQQRIDAIQQIIVPHVWDTVIAEGRIMPEAPEKILLGSLDSGRVYATDDSDNSFKLVPRWSCGSLSDGRCILPAPDVSVNPEVCGVQAPYGYVTGVRGGFEVSFCVETNAGRWQARNDDFDHAYSARGLTPGWWKYTREGLDKIGS